MTATKIQPGDDTHLTLLMAPHSLNFVTGADRAALLAYGRDVFAAARDSKCLAQIEEPAGAAPAAVAPQGDKDDSLLLCASDLQHSAIYDSHSEMQDCARSVADRIKALAAPALEAPGAREVTVERYEIPGGMRSALEDVISYLRSHGRCDLVRLMQELYTAISPWDGGSCSDVPDALVPARPDAEYLLSIARNNRWPMLMRAHIKSAALATAPALEAPAAPESAPWCPDVCPITGRPFFMWIDHWQTGKPVPTYGGPYDSYTIPVKDSDGSFECERYDHDEGGWLTEGAGWHCLGVRLVDDQSFVVDPSNPRYHEIEAFAAAAPQAQASAPDWWRGRADEIEVRVARSGSQEAMRCYTDMRTLLQAAAPALEAPAAPAAPMPWTNARQPHDPKIQDGYMESDLAWCRRNRDAVTWLIDNQAEIRAALAGVPQAPAAAGIDQLLDALSQHDDPCDDIADAINRVRVLRAEADCRIRAENTRVDRTAHLSAGTPTSVVLNVLRVALDRADMRHRATGFMGHEIATAVEWVRAAIAAQAKEGGAA